MEQALWSRLVIPLFPYESNISLAAVPSGYALGALPRAIRSYIKDVVAYCKKHKELVKIPVCSVLWTANNHEHTLVYLFTKSRGGNEKGTFFCFPTLGKTSTVQSGISTLSTSKTWRAERS